jgi:hypothetical protein
MRNITALVIFLLIYLATQLNAEADPPVVSRFVITDVNPRSFAAVWISSEPSTCNLKVFDEQKNLLSGLAIIPESEQHPPAEDLGVMMVRVGGLTPDTTYYLQSITTSKRDRSETIYPQETTINVRTQKSAIVVNNCILAQKIYSFGKVPANGSLLIVSVEDSYPVSGWVGSSPNTLSAWALVDLNNVYDSSKNMNREISGGETMVVQVYGGANEYASYQSKVPTLCQSGIILTLDPPIVLDKEKMTLPWIPLLLLDE